MLILILYVRLRSVSSCMRISFSLGYFLHLLQYVYYDMMGPTYSSMIHILPTSTSISKVYTKG